MTKCGIILNRHVWTKLPTADIWSDRRQCEKCGRIEEMRVGNAGIGDGFSSLFNTWQKVKI